MRYLLVSAFVLLLATPALAEDPEIVVFNSVPEVVQPCVDAAWVVSSNVKAYYAGEEDLWIADVNDGADIVVFDVHANFTQAGPPLGSSAQLDAFDAYLRADSHHRGVIAVWFFSFFITDPIWDTFGVTYCTEFFTTIPMHQWDTDHPIFSGVPNPLLAPHDVWPWDGAMVEPRDGATAIGGFFSSSPISCQAGVVVGPEERTVYIGETGVSSGRSDVDGDTVPDWQEMYINIYNYLLNSGPTATEPTSWGNVKTLYR